MEKINMKNTTRIFVIYIALVLQSSADLIYPGLDEPPPPPAARLVEIRDAFVKMPRPIAYDIVVHRGGWSGNTFRVPLKGKTQSWATQFSTWELIYALWPYLDNRRYDAEACILLTGKIGSVHVGSTYTTFVDQSNLGDWDHERRMLVEWCKSDCRVAVGQSSNPFWKPHQVLFQYDYKKFQAMADKPVERAEWIEKLRGWLRDPEVITNNPMEVYKIARALSNLKATEAAPEIAELLFYDWQQGGNYRFDLDFYEKFRPLDNIGYYYSDKVERMQIGPPAECRMMAVLRAVAGTNAIPLALGRYLRTSAEDRLEKPGGGYASALMIRFFTLLKKTGWNNYFTQADAIVAIQAYKASCKDLTTDQKALLDDLIATIKSGRYQHGSEFVDNNWFGKLPFTHQVLSNGDIVGGYRLGDSFFSFWSKGLLGKVDGAWLAAHPDQAKMEEKDMQGVSLDSSRETEYQTFRDKTLPLFAGHLVTNAVQLKPRQDRKWYESSH